MTEMVPMQMEDWKRMLPGLVFVVLIASIPAIIGFVVMRRGRSPVYLLLGLAWAALLLAISLPSIRPARSTAQRNSCIAYLKQIDGAKAQWASEQKPEASIVPQFSDLTPFLKNGFMPTCPTGGTYTLGTVNEPPRCGHADKGHKLE